MKHATFTALGSALNREWRQFSLGTVLILVALGLGLGVALAGGGFVSTEGAIAICGLSLLAVAAAAAQFGGSPKTLPTGDSARGVVLLLAFGIWCLASTIWSVRPDLSLSWGAMACGYGLLVFAVAGAAAGSAGSRKVGFAGVAFVALVICLLALSTRLHSDTAQTIGGLENARRLRGALGYWNALGIFATIGLLLSARAAISSNLALQVRGFAGGLAIVGAATLLLSQSRGAMLALLIGMFVLGRLAGSGRLRLPMFVGVSLLAAVPVAVAAAGKVKGEAVVGAAGAPVIVLSLLVACAFGAAFAVWLALRERGGTWPERASYRICGLARRWVLILAVILGIGYTVQSGGPVDAVRNIGNNLASSDKIAPVAGSGRVLSLSSSNRASWWAEALGSWADRPIAGFGAGSFLTARLRYRTDQTNVAQPHSLPLEVLSGTGIVGLGLLASAILLLLRAALTRLREAPTDRQRAIQAALITAFLVWLIQACLDWTWSLPGVTIPALCALAIASSSWAKPAPVEPVVVDDPGPAGVPEPEQTLELRERSLILLGAVAASMILCAITVVPLIGANYASSVQERLGTPLTTAKQVQDVTSDARRAANLDVLGLKPLSATRALAQSLNDPRQMLAAAIEGTQRQPENPLSWIELAQVYGSLGQPANVKAAAARALQLDPQSVLAVDILNGVSSDAEDPAKSPTVAPTPLSR